MLETNFYVKRTKQFFLKTFQYKLLFKKKFHKHIMLNNNNNYSFDAKVNNIFCLKNILIRKDIFQKVKIIKCFASF